MTRKVTKSVPEFTQTPDVTFQPQTARGLQNGINKIVNAVRPSFGPYPRAVAIDRMMSNQPPELLNSGGIISRRIIEIPVPDENAGAMYIRGALWNLHERVGDGVATSAIIFQSIFNQGLQYIASGGNAMILRRYLETGMQYIIEALDELIVPINGADALTGVAKTVCHDPEVAATLGRIVSIIGEYGILEIRAGHGRGVERELISGSYWPGAIFSKKMIFDNIKNRTVFENAAILISDLEIEEPQEFLPVIRAAVEAQIEHLVVMCSKLSESVQGLMFQSRASGKLQIIAVKTPSIRSDVQMTNMIDIGILTGGSPLLKATSDSLKSVTPEHFGFARRIWANQGYTGIVHPQGDPKLIRKHIISLRNGFKKATKSEERQMLQERIGRLHGGAAAIDVGGLTETEMETRKVLTKRTADALRGAAREGVLPGGGSALLSCRSALDKLIENDHSVDARAAHRILNSALEAPFRTLLDNSGNSPGRILSKVEDAGSGFGFDVVTGNVCEMIPNGIMDVATVQKQALISAIRSAAMALTIDVVVHRKNPPLVTDPDAPGI